MLFQFYKANSNYQLNIKESTISIKLFVTTRVVCRIPEPEYVWNMHHISSNKSPRDLIDFEE